MGRKVGGIDDIPDPLILHHDLAAQWVHDADQQVHAVDPRVAGGRILADVDVGVFVDLQHLVRGTVAVDIHKAHLGVHTGRPCSRAQLEPVAPEGVKLEIDGSAGRQ